MHLTRAVASLTVPGGQEFLFPHFSSNFDQFSLSFLNFYAFSSSFWPSGWATRPPGKALPGYATAPNPKLSMFWELSQNYQLFWKLIWLSGSKLSEKVQKWHSHFRPSVSWVIDWNMQNIVCIQYISNTLQIFLVWKGGIWGGCAPSGAMKTLQFSNLICAIWCILFDNIPKKGSPFRW